jgi:hypothetical protein
VKARIILTYIYAMNINEVKYSNYLSQFFKIIIKDAEIKDNLIIEKSLLNLDIKYK